MKFKNIISLAVSAAMTAALLAAPGVSAEEAADNEVKVFSYAFDGADSDTSWSGYNAAQLVDDADNGTKVFRLDSTVRQISKSGQTLLGEYTYSYDFKADALSSNPYADLIRNGGNYTYRDRLIFSNGKALLNGAATPNTCFIEAGKWYHVDWTVDGVNKQYTIKVAGSVSSNNANFAQGTINLGTFAIGDTTNGNVNSPFVYTSGMYMVNTTPANGNVYLDNLKAVAAAPSMETAKTADMGAAQISIRSNQFYKEDTGKVTVTNNSKTVDPSEYELTWGETRQMSNADYVTAPVINFTNGLSAGEYTVTFNGINTSYNKAVTMSVSFVVELTNPLAGFAENTGLELNENVISGFVNGYPASAVVPVWKDGVNDAEGVIKNLYGETVTEGGIYNDYIYEVTVGGQIFTYTFDADTDIYSSRFDTEMALTDKTEAISKSNRNQAGNFVPVSDAEFTVPDITPTKADGASATWDQSKFQAVYITEEGLTLTRETAPYMSGRAISLRAENYAGTSNIQVLKDFYTDKYPVQISVSVMPDGNGDVSLGIKSSYYNESSTSTNSFLAPISFMADGSIYCFGEKSGEYEPGNWYNVSVVLDKVTVGDVTTKTAYAYLNGERIGSAYDWSNIAATIEANEGFYSLTMRENYKTADNAVTSKSYFDNLQICELYNADTAPNGYMFAPVSTNASVVIDNQGGMIYAPASLTAEEVIGAISTPAAVTKRVEDGKLVIGLGDYVQTYTLSNDVYMTLQNAADTEIYALCEGTNLVTVKNAPDGVLIGALYNSDGTLDSVYTADIAQGSAQITIDAQAGQKAKIMGWSSIYAQQPVFEKAKNY